MQKYKKTMNKRGECARVHTHTHTHTHTYIYIYIYIYNVMLLQGKEKWEMGNGHSYKEANPFPYNLPTYPKGVFFFFLMKEKSSWKFFIGEGFSKEKGRKTIPK